MFVYDASGLELTYEGVAVKGNTLVIKDIVAMGSLSSSLGKVVLMLSFVSKFQSSHTFSLCCLTFERLMCVGSTVVRVDPLCFLAWYRKNQLNHGLVACCFLFLMHC